MVQTDQLGIITSAVPLQLAMMIIIIIALTMIAIATTTAATTATQKYSQKGK